MFFHGFHNTEQPISVVRRVDNNKTNETLILVQHANSAKIVNEISNETANCNEVLMNPAEYGIAIAIVNDLPYRVEILEANDDGQCFLCDLLTPERNPLLRRVNFTR